MKDLTHLIIQEWKSRTSESLEQINNKLSNIHRIEIKDLTSYLKNATAEVFDKFNCLECANCCKTTPPIFTNKDVKRIAKYLKITPKYFKRLYLIEDVDGTLVGAKVPCSFLDHSNKCTIYEVRPQACRSFPHTDDRNFAFHKKLNLKNADLCPAAYKIMKEL